MDITKEIKKTTLYLEPAIIAKLDKIKDRRQKDNPRILITYRALINEFLEAALKNVK